MVVPPVGIARPAAGRRLTCAAAADHTEHERERTSMIWNDVFTVQIPLLEKVLRTVLVYAGLAVLLRFGGKRELAQLNSFDLVVVLLLSNVVQNAVIGNDQSLAGGLLGALVLVTVNSATVRLVNRHPTLERLFEGTPTLLVERGQMLRDKIRNLGLREADITVALRRQGAADVDDVERATLAPGGSIVVTLTDEARDITNAEMLRANDAIVADIRAQLAAMEQRLTERLDALH